MEKISLDKNDIELINKIIKVTTTINNIYNQLFNLENHNKENNDQYRKAINNLKIASLVEDDLYERLNLNYEKIIAIDEYLFSDFNEELLDDLENIANQNYNNRILHRIKNILFNKFLTDYKTINPNEVIKQMEDCNYKNPSKVFDYINNSIVDKIIKKDILNAYLVFLQEYINKDNQLHKNQVFKTYLLNSKYNVIFINKDIEKEMIDSNFNIDEFIYIGSKFIADVLESSINMYEATKNNLAEEICMTQFANLLKIEDQDYKNIQNEITSIISTSLIRAALLLMDDTNITNVNYNFLELIESEEDLEEKINNTISQQIIENCFKKNKNDINKVFTLSLY